MEKNFLNITPESGNGNQEVTINAKANISLEDREEMLIEDLILNRERGFCKNNPRGCTFYG